MAKRLLCGLTRAELAVSRQELSTWYANGPGASVIATKPVIIDIDDVDTRLERTGRIQRAKIRAAVAAMPVPDDMTLGDIKAEIKSLDTKYAGPHGPGTPSACDNILRFMIDKSRLHQLREALAI